MKSKVLFMSLLICAVGLAPTFALDTSGWRASYDGKHPAVCEVFAENFKSPASGVLVHKQGPLGIVVTAAHVGAVADEFTVKFPNGESYVSYQVWGDKDGWDLAGLVIDAPKNVEPVPIATRAPPEGAMVKIAGYGNDLYEERRAKVLGYAAPRATSDGAYSPPAGLGSYQMRVGVHSRNGDSGGGIFNTNGELVGIVSSTDGRSTSAPANWPTGNFMTRLWSNVCNQYATQALPYRSQNERDKMRLESQIDQLRSYQQGLPPLPTPQPPAPVIVEVEKDNTKTLPGRIADKQADWLVEHGGPISSRIAEAASENLDDESVGIRFKGFTQAKVALLVFLGGIALAIFIVVRVVHRVNKKLIPKLEAMAEKTPNTVDDELVKLLKQAHERVETVEQRINKFIPDLSEARARAEAAIEAAAKVATASVPGSGAVIAAAQAAVEAAKRDSEAKSSGS